MAFSGTLTEFPVPDLLDLLSEQKKTGVLKLVKEKKVSAVVFFADGNIISASKSDVHFPRYLTPSSSSGAGIDLKKIYKKMRLIVQDIVTDLMDWDIGAYSFVADATLEPEYALDEPLETQELVFEGLRLLDEYDDIRKRIPSLEALLVPAPTARISRELTRRQIRAFMLMDGTHTIQQLLDRVNLGKYEFLQIVDALQHAGVITVVPPKNSATLDDATASKRRANRDAVRKKLESQEISNPDLRNSLSNEDIQKVLDSFAKKPLEVLFDKGTIETLMMFTRVCSTNGLEFTLMRILHLYFNTLKSPATEIRVKGAEILIFFARELNSGGKMLHMTELANFLLSQLEDEPVFLVYSNIAKTLFELEHLFRDKENLEISDRIIATFTRHIGEKSPRKAPEKKFIANLLASLPQEKALKALVNGLEDDEISNDIAELLSGMGERGLPFLVEIFKECDRKRLWVRLMALIEKAGIVAQKHLIPHLKDDRWFVRSNIAEILGNIGNVVAANALGNLINDPMPQVREQVVRSVAQIQGTGAEKYLVSTVKDPEPTIQLLSVRLLGIHGTNRAARMLSTLILSKYFKVDDGDNELLGEVCNTLGKIGDKIAVDPLVQLLQNKNLLRTSLLGLVPANACNALARLGDPKALPVLTELSNTKNQNIKLAALRAIKRINTLKAVP